jgi:hypothetical protein
MKAGAATPAFFRLTGDNRNLPKQAAEIGITAFSCFENSKMLFCHG